ncbi:hypothetical protein NW762_013058 [Fusarium torreyae]|uniref:Uncharacterized protein n=1 Tax=Fusarium torreyae TaxID=1237075 RepID=A0A9W8V7Y1_9HYPO|nr:hypothetical protein NW762_013058 [Fusarium torreyae]
MKFFTAALLALSASSAVAVPAESQDAKIQRFYDAMAEVQDAASVLAKPDDEAASARLPDPWCFGCRNGEECIVDFVPAILRAVNILRQY